MSNKRANRFPLAAPTSGGTSNGPSSGSPTSLNSGSHDICPCSGIVSIFPSTHIIALVQARTQDLPKVGGGGARAGVGGGPTITHHQNQEVFEFLGGPILRTKQIEKCMTK